MATPLSGRTLEELLDAHRWSAYQVLILLLASLAILLDGFDNQALGFALPSIMADWQLSKAALGPALAASQVGMMAGAISGGFVGDRFGRKMALIGSVLLFGTATLCVAWTESVVSLAAFRFVAGIGMGAAFPNVAALAAEFTPARHRGLAVTIGIVSVPLGGTIGGVIAAWILPAYGWQALFILAGLIPLLVALLLLIVLPESLAFLLNRPQANARRVRTICQRIGIPVPAAKAAMPSPVEQGLGTPTLLSREYLSDTLWLWTAFFFCLASIYMAFGWLPTLLVSNGYDLATASTGLAVFNLGGVVAALGTGWLIGRVGSRRPMVILAIGGVLTAAFSALFPELLASDRSILLIALTLQGACVNGVQTTLYALAAQVYPTRGRATGVGAAASFGRIGAIMSSLAGGAAITLGADLAFHGIIAASMTVVAVALGMIRRHQAHR